MLNYSEKIEKLLTEIDNFDNIVIGAGSGFSTASVMTYDGDRFKKYFFDFIDKYGLKDMYSGGFYNFDNPEIYWAFWSRMIWINRYMNPDKETYQLLYQLIKDKNYFVLTTNVDHQFQRAGFSKDRLFYTQGDYGLFQIGNRTVDNYDFIKKMILDQGFKIEKNNQLTFDKNNIKMQVSLTLINEIKNYKRNLREDESFVEDKGWHQAALRFEKYISKYHQSKILYLELGVGMNTPSIIKYPFWQLTMQNSEARLVTIDKMRVGVPAEIKNKTLEFENDIDQVLKDLVKSQTN